MPGPRHLDDQGPAGYRLGAKLDGAGEVYEARHPRFPGRLAIKLFPGAVGEGPVAISAFAREAGRVSILRHPRIAQVMDSGVLPDRTPFVAMERLQGQTLEGLLVRRGPLPLPQAFSVIRDIVLGLSAAHEAGVVHREIRPDNIFLVGRDDMELGFVKLLDFGVSQLTWAPRAAGRGISVDGARYLAPEQVRRGLGGVDARADEFALAVLTYRMLRGPDPFLGPATARASAVDGVLGKALDEHPDRRFPSVGHFFRAFEEAIISSVPTPPPVRISVASQAAPGSMDATRRVAAASVLRHGIQLDKTAQARMAPGGIASGGMTPTSMTPTTVMPVRAMPSSAPSANTPPATPAPDRTPPPRTAPVSHKAITKEVALFAGAERRDHPAHRESVRREGALAERFFEEGERHEETRWKHAPVARERIGVAPDIQFSSFDRVPRRRTPLAMVLLVAAIVGTGFAWRRLGWPPPRTLWEESRIGRTVYFFRTGLPWVGQGTSSPTQAAPSAAQLPAKPAEPAGLVAPSVLTEPANEAAPSVIAEPTGEAKLPVTAEPTGEAEPPVTTEPAGVPAQPVAHEPEGAAAPPTGAQAAGKESGSTSANSPGAVVPASSSTDKSRPRRSADASPRSDRGSALRGYVWSPSEQRMVPAAR